MESAWRSGQSPYQDYPYQDLLTQAFREIPRDMRIPPLKIRTIPESNPLKSVRRLAAAALGAVFLQSGIFRDLEISVSKSDQLLEAIRSIEKLGSDLEIEISRSRNTPHFRTTGAEAAAGVDLRQLRSRHAVGGRLA